MPPKKDSAAGTESVTGFQTKETKLLAAAFLSSTAPGKWDYDLMAKLTGNTAMSLRKMWPPVKQKALEAHPSFAAILGVSGNGEAAKAVPAKPNASKKRKASVPVEEAEDENSADGEPDVPKAEPKKKAAGKGRGRKKVKMEEVKEEADQDSGLSDVPEEAD